MISSAASSILCIGICMVRALCLWGAGFAVDQRLAGLDDVEETGTMSSRRSPPGALTRV